MDSDAWTYKRKNGTFGFKIKPGVVPFIASPFLHSDYSTGVFSHIIDENNTKSTQTDYTICNDIDESQESQFPNCNIKEENVAEDMSEHGFKEDTAEEDTTEDVESTALQNISNIPGICTEEIKLETDFSFDEGSIESYHDDSNTSVEFSPLSMTLMIMNRRPRHYMGIKNNSLHVILHLTKATNLSEEKVMLTLRKIKLNEDFQTLADSFDIEKKVLKNILAIL